MTVLEQLVPLEAVKAQLAGRQPTLLHDPGGKFDGLYASALRSIATQVVFVTGDPPPAPLRNLAIEAVAIGTAWTIEASVYPQQLNQDGSRAEQLRTSFLSLMDMLRSRSPQRDTRRGVGSQRLLACDGYSHAAPLQPPGTTYPYLLWENLA